MSRKISDAIAPSKKTGKKSTEAKNYGRVEPFVPKPAANSFNDDGTEEANLRPVNNPQLEILYKNAPGTVARGATRERFEKVLVDVECSVCHEKSQVEPIYANTAYRCNECFKPGRRKKK